MWKYALLLALVSLPAGVRAQPAPPASAAERAYPMQAVLMTALNAPRLHLGDRVMTKLDRPWTFGRCKLDKGSILFGHVAALTLRSHASRSSEVALLFQADCGNGDAQALTWIALLAPDNDSFAELHDGNPVVTQALRSSSFGESGGLGASMASQTNHADLSNRQAPNLPISTAPLEDKSHPRPQFVRSGEVWRLPDLALSVATGPTGSSVVSSPKKDVRLPSGSVLVLSPAAVPASTLAVANSAAASRVAPVAEVGRAADPPDPAGKPLPAAPPASLPEQTEVCAAPTCSIALSSDISSVPGAPARTVGLKELGYAPHLNREVPALQYDAALAFLGTRELLFTFNPHALVSRADGEPPANHAHTVRAVLIDLANATVERTVDWRVTDGKQYLWQMGGGRIMAHAGQELKVCGAGLQEQSTVHLTGPLAFLRHSPDWNHIAVGVIRELHTRALHTEIETNTSAEPEEQVDIALLDGNLSRLGTAAESSRVLPPVLSNTGEIVLLRAGQNRWTYRETQWDGASRMLLRLGSACMPMMNSFGPNLLFVTGCDTRNVGRWYRVLRADGSPVLKGNSTLADLDPTAIADNYGALFALARSRGNSSYTFGLPFHGTDLTSESVHVYRANDGQNVFTAKMHLPIPTIEPAAFNPDGASLAVLDGEQIAIYPLPHD